MAFELVGALGQACYVLQHELMHHLLFTRPNSNELVGSLLSAFLGTRFSVGRRMHWEHRRKVVYGGDPNEIYHDVSERRPGVATARFCLFHLLAGRLVNLVISNLHSVISIAFPGKQSTQSLRQLAIPAAKERRDFIMLLSVQAGMLLGVSLVPSPWVNFRLYVVRLSTLTAFFEGMRSFSEPVLPGESPL